MLEQSLTLSPSMAGKPPARTSTIPEVHVEAPCPKQPQPQEQIVDRATPLHKQTRTLGIFLKKEPLQPLSHENLEDVDEGLYGLISEKVNIFCQSRNLKSTYYMTVDYDHGPQCPEKCHSKKIFKRIFDEAKISDCFNVKVFLNGEASTTKKTTPWKKAFDILSEGRLIKGKDKVIRKDSWRIFSEDPSHIKRICHEDECMQKIFGDEQACQDLQKNGIKLLAIFILIEKPSMATAFCHFWENDCRDKDLPFERDDRFTWCDSGLWESVWDMQWQVMPIELVCLDKGIPPSRFDEHQVLPFTIGATLGKGAYGTVLEITLDEDHDVIYEALRACKAGKLETVLNPPLAAKKLEDPASETQVILDNKENRETRILTNLADFKHPHLIQLITAFYHGREYYMIFPKARSSLRDVFKKEQHVGDTEYLLWLLRQLYGLAGGLNKIHTGASNDMFLGVPTANGQKGLHGDIAAANLLIMDTLPDLKENESSFGRTQICDFGIGKMVDNKNIALSVVSVTNRGQPSYAPPESTCGKSDVPPQSRWRDIWCLGCVFFEICIWLLEGGIKLTEFSSERGNSPEDTSNPGAKVPTYYHLTNVDGKKQQQLKPEVLATMKRLRRGGNWPEKSWPSVKDAFNGILDLVERCWTITPFNARPDAAKIESELREISDKFAKELEKQKKLEHNLSRSHLAKDLKPSEGQVLSQLHNYSVDKTQRSDEHSINSTYEAHMISITNNFEYGPVYSGGDPRRLGPI